MAELFLFDTASGGAGYAAEAGEELAAVLAQTEELLRNCPAACERSCTKCLRHYGNRFLHARLDRRLGLDLLRYAQHGETPAIASPAQQARTLAPLAQFLTLEGWGVQAETEYGSVTIPLLATSPAGTTIAIGTHPTLMATAHAPHLHTLHKHGSHPVFVLPEYVVERDLPAAYQYLTTGAPSPSRPPGTTAMLSTAMQGSEVDLPVMALSDLVTGPPVVIDHIRLRVQAPTGCFAVRIPLGALARLGIPQDAWMVLRPPTDEDCDGTQRLLVSRITGDFKLTGAAWTVAHVKRLTDADGDRMQVSYPRPEAEFRPERVRGADLRVLGAVLAVLPAGSV
jgi:hypothetical protein